MPTISDLREVKSIFDIPEGDTSEDKKLLFFIEQASGWIEELLNRKGQLFYKSRTQYYRGTGSTQLLLKARPVFPNPPAPFSAISVNVDENGVFGTASGSFTGDPTNQPLVYGTDYGLRIDQDDGSSRCGILIRYKDFWPRRQIRQTGYLSPFVAQDPGSVQVVYTAGYSLDMLPAQLRLAANTLIGKLRGFFPLAYELGGDGYEERSVSIIAEKKNYLLSQVWDMIMPYRNWHF